MYESVVVICVCVCLSWPPSLHVLTPNVAGFVCKENVVAAGSAGQVCRGVSVCSTRVRETD